MRIIVRISEGERIPRGYGAAYHDWRRRQEVMMPIPLNIIVALFLRLKEWAIVGVMHWPDKRVLHLEMDLLRANQLKDDVDAQRVLEHAKRVNVEIELKAVKRDLWMKDAEIADLKEKNPIPPTDHA